MSESIEQALTESTVMVLETSAFMSIWPWSAEDGELPEPDMAATISFVGASSGQLTLRMCSDLLPTLSRNMLGGLEESDASPENARDALKEMLNMICGNFLTSWHGADSVFKLHPPEIVPPESALSAPPIGAIVKFCLENTICIIQATIESEAEPVPSAQTAING